MGHFLATVAAVPLGDVLVNDVQATNIIGSDCLTASIWVTGVDGMYVYLCVCERVCTCVQVCVEGWERECTVEKLAKLSELINHTCIWHVVWQDSCTMSGFLQSIT